MNLSKAIVVSLLVFNVHSHASSDGHGSPAPASAPSAHAAPAPKTEKSTRIDPDRVIDQLLKGNQRFITGMSSHPNLSPERRIDNARNGQKPIVSILSCSDSRVPLEHIFDAGLGDLFVIRVAGNVAEKSQIGSIEYGAGHLGTSLIMVLGHSKCGAVTAAVKKAEVSPCIKSIINNIEPAIVEVNRNHSKLTEEQVVEKTITENIWQTIDDIFRASEEIRHLVSTNKVKVVGALYDIETGKAQILGVHNKQHQLIKSYSEKSGVHGQSAKSGKKDSHSSH